MKSSGKTQGDTLGVAERDLCEDKSTALIVHQEDLRFTASLVAHELGEFIWLNENYSFQF